jgi:hypothetical protein
VTAPSSRELHADRRASIHRRAFDFIVTLLTLYRAFFHVKYKQASSGIFRTFVRDGIFYFLAISTLNAYVLPPNARLPAAERSLAL